MQAWVSLGCPRHHRSQVARISLTPGHSLLVAPGDCGDFILSRNRFQHGASAAPRTAAASEPALNTPAQPAFVLETIVVAQLLARSDGALRANEHTAVIVFDRFTIRIAAMVDPSRSVATLTRVEDGTVVEPEQQGMVGIGRVSCRPIVGNIGRQSLAAVLDDTRSFANRPRREDAPAVRRRRADDVRRWLRSRHEYGERPCDDAKPRGTLAFLFSG